MNEKEGGNGFQEQRRRDIASMAADNLTNNREYMRLVEKYAVASKKRDYIKMVELSTRIKKMKEDEVERLSRRESEMRKNVNRLAEMLKSLDVSEHDRYQELLAALSLLLDMIDTTFSDINKILRRNDMGVEMGNFDEFVAAKKLAWEMAFDEQGKMARYKNELWSEESDRIYKYLIERCAVYCRKVDRIEAKMAEKK